MLGATLLVAFVLWQPINSLVVPSSHAHVVHERRHLKSDTGPWLRGPRADGNLVVGGRLGLVQKDIEHGEKLLQEVSDPGSAKFGLHYTEEEIAHLFAPDDKTIRRVGEWLEKAVDNLTMAGNKQWFRFDTKLSSLESLLNTKYYEYEHHRTGEISIGCDHYSVPENLREHIDFVTPGLTMLERLRPSKSKLALKKRERSRTIPQKHKGPPPLPFPTNMSVSSTNAQGCDTIVTPLCIKSLYGINDKVIHKAGDGNSIGIYEGILDFLNQKDLNAFLAMFSYHDPPYPKNVYPETFLVDGAPSPRLATSGIESALDFDIVYPLSYPIPIKLLQVDDYHWESEALPGYSTFLDYIDGSYCTKAAYGISGDTPGYDAVYPDPETNSTNPWLKPHQCGITKPPRVISISYGSREFGTSYTRRECQEFMKLGMQGVTVFASSGDFGVGESANGCDANGPGVFLPTHLSCPYITSVGSTLLPKGGVAGTTREVATTRFASGGGFSNIHPRPFFQNRTLANYFANYNPPYQSYNTSYNAYADGVTGRYNRNGRGIPDVSAVGDNIAIYWRGRAGLSGGTSASAPIWAGIISRINGARLAAGKSTVGFINPTLYSHPAVMNDVVRGTNPNCGTAGFKAVPGWDPVSGLGTPNYQKLKALFLSLP